MQWSVRSDQNGSTLAHYGVPGMKWGVRKEYELKGRKTKKKSKTTTSSNDNVTTTVTKHGDDVYDEYRKQIKPLIDFDRGGGSVHTPGLIASKKLDDLPKIDNRLSEDLEAWKINKGATTQKRLTNCFECTIAYEMRKRGYDVQANDKRGATAAEMLHAFDIKDSFSIQVSTINYNNFNNQRFANDFYDQVASNCLEYGDGARGTLDVYWPLGGGHAMSWYIEDGEFHLIDPQDTSRDARECLINCNGKAEVFRLDNAELLPGAVDFVEPYKSPGKVTIKNKVKKLIKNIGKDVSDLISKGSEFVEKLFKNLFDKKTK